MKTPEYTFIVPVYNGEKFILETINSIQSQSLKNIEIIVLDNGSNDNTVNIVNGIQDSRLKLLSFPHVTKLSESLNRSFDIDIASQLFSIIHADDKIQSNFCFRAIETSKQNKSHDLFFFEASIIDELSNTKFSLKNSFKHLSHLNGNYSGSSGFFRLLCWNTLIAPSAVYKKSSIENYHRFDDNFTFLTDLMFWLRYLLDGGKIMVVKEPLIELRVHSSQQSSKFKESKTKNKEYKKLREDLSSAYPKYIHSISLFYHVNSLLNFLLHFLRKLK